MSQTMRARAFGVLDDDGMPSAARRLCDFAFAAAILIWLAEGVLRTLPDLGETFRLEFRIAETAVAVLFAVEYALRLWIEPERYHAGAMAEWRARRAYAISGLGVVDLAVPVVFLIGDGVLRLDGGMIEFLELFAVFKLTRYFPGLDLVISVFRTEARPMGAALAATLTLLLLASSAMYYIERGAQPDAFASIPHAMWWGIVTIATVGYGDMAPVTPVGKLASGVVILIGIALFAVPAGILANGFAVELKKRDFLVTWRLVAKLPLFADLDASIIASIARLLRAKSMPRDGVVFRKGEPGHSMFFVLAGEVEVHVPPKGVRLGAGSYFGEIALIMDTPRTATITAASACELLELGQTDFQRVCNEYPQLKARVEHEAQARLAQNR
ncbi:MAG: cyclic nucleotide-gated ion channel [Tagaea sp.]